MDTVSVAPAARYKTVESILDSNKGVGPGFHFLRYALAVTIFLFHSYYVVKGQVGTIGYNDLNRNLAVNVPAQAGDVYTLTSVLRPGLFALVASFFAVSGFLVTGSAQRLRSVKTFLWFRALRIFPALTVETLLSAFILGPLVTILPLQLFFTDPIFWRYMGNILGFISFRLPGVFQDNPVRDIVNVNLWTLPGEFYCYLIISILMFATVIYSRRGLLIAVLISTILLIGANLLYGIKLRSNTTHFTSTMIVYYFFVGCLFFNFRDKIIIDFRLFLVSGLIYWFITFYEVHDMLAPIFLTYCTIYIGCQSFSFFDRLLPGDYSYGIYLYGFPIQQAFVYFFPQYRYTILVALGAGVVTLTFAVASWYIVEKPALKLKTLVKPRAKPAASPSN